jgi:TonB family protein
MSGQDIDKMFQEAQSRDFKAVGLPVRLQAHIASQLRPFVSRNVIAKISGSDPRRADQAVIYTAHYDHLGINPSMPGDNIYNGAVDNGTGCGILLELARAWSLAKTAPPRSILFAAVTAEEQGLLGSEYLGKHSPVPPGKIALDLNFDALAPIGDPEEAEVSGAERTTFYPVVEATAKEFGFAIRPDSRPEAGHYYRSDHFSLARVGVPSFSIGEGLKFKGHDAAWGEVQAQDYVDHRYHQPSDEYHPEMDFTGLAKMARFGFVLGAKAAAQPEIVGWQPGDEFEAARKKSQATSPAASNLFDGFLSFRVEYCEPIHYPPLARVAQIADTVRLHVSLDHSGAVTGVLVVAGNPLLARTAQENIRRWRFAPVVDGDSEFDLSYDFALRDRQAETANEEVSFASPGKILITVSRPVPDSYSETAGTRHWR